MLSTKLRRWITVLAISPAFPIFANFLFALGWFGTHGRVAADLALIYVILIIFFVAPTSDEVRKEIAADRERKGGLK